MMVAAAEMDGLAAAFSSSSSSPSPLRNVPESQSLEQGAREIYDSGVRFDGASIINEKGDSVDLDQSLCRALEKLESLKKELALKLGMILSVKCQIADVPTQAELIQYEHRFSELYNEIQEKHQQTRKCFATYNALLEIKELMLKETSLLNSIDLQFQEAIARTVGRSKLTESMEVILKGTRKKLKKVQLDLQEEQKVCHSLKEKYSNAISEQRNFSLLLKTFQVECTKNERLRCLSSIQSHPSH